MWVCSAAVSPLKDLVSASKEGPEQFSRLFLNLFGLAVLSGAGFILSPSLALSYGSWMPRPGHDRVCPSADKIGRGRSAEPQLQTDMEHNKQVLGCGGN